MSTRLQIQLYKGGSTEDFRRDAEETAEALGGNLTWGAVGDRYSDFRFRSDGLLHATYVADQGIGGNFSLELGRRSGLPWIELRISEGSLWDYTLFRGDKTVDNFSPFPEYWEDPDAPDFEQLQRGCVGNADTLATVWGIPVERIERYVRRWGWIPGKTEEEFGKHILTGKAYPADRFNYGECEQFYDVLKALGGMAPFIGYDNHRLELPPPPWRKNL